MFESSHCSKTFFLPSPHTLTQDYPTIDFPPWHNQLPEESVNPLAHPVHVVPLVQVVQNIGQ